MIAALSLAGVGAGAPLAHGAGESVLASCAIRFGKLLRILPAPERDFRKSGRRARNALVMDNHERHFAANYVAAMALFRRQGTRWAWTPQSGGMHRGMLILPDPSGSILNRQAKDALESTGHQLVYSVDFPWAEKMRGIFSGAATDLVGPEAGTDRAAKVVYASQSMVPAGRLGHIERHEFSHGLLNRLEDEGRDTGILLPKLRADVKSGYRTGIPSYPSSVDAQELWAYADQIRGMGDAILRQKPGSLEASRAMDELQVYLDAYLELVRGFNAQAAAAREGLAAAGGAAEVATGKIRFGGRSGNAFELAPREGKAPTESTLSPRLARLQSATYRIDRLISGFLDSEAALPYDEATRQWSEDFRRLVREPSEIILEENRAFAAEVGATAGNTEVETRLLAYRAAFER